MLLKNAFFLLFPVFFTTQGASQSVKDSVDLNSSLKEVVVTAFHTGMRWKELPAALAVLTNKEINQYSPVSLVPVMNMVPGVRMEERSPGSYRLSMRGSLLRSPFGVRNIKVYLNGIPLTDATGNTYLNLLDLQQANQIEIAKGPAASVYGAGTGGAVLFNRNQLFTDSGVHHYAAGFSAGSYGMNQQSGEWNYSNSTFTSALQLNRVQSDGYREQSALLKSGINWQTASRFNNQEFSTLLFYTKLYYGTPGGITAAQMLLNPTLSRQPAGLLPGALQQKAAITNSTLFLAVKHVYTLNDQVQIRSFLSGSSTDFSNPFITNFEERKELNLNAGVQLITKLFKSGSGLQWINGIEGMFNRSAISNFNNKEGIAGLLQNNDLLFSKQAFFYSQIKYRLFSRLTVTAGFSVNHQSYEYKRLSDPQPVSAKRIISAPFVPRLALSYKLNNDLTLYAIAAEGFSSPSLAEVRPSDGNFYPFLQAEKGWNLEAGIKGTVMKERITIDLAFYRFKLNDAIVRRTDNAGADYFVNAGSTLQQGAELLMKYQLIRKANGFVRSVSLMNSFSFQPYRFLDYRQGSTDFSGNHLTGVPEKSWITGVNMTAKYGWYLNTMLNSTSGIPLNDANTVSAAAYQLLHAKIGKTFGWQKNRLEVFAGGDNLLNQLYSLGNDINAAGNRYFNPAAARNWYAGIRFGFQ